MPLVMLTPRELFRAQANSVPPVMAEAIVRANVAWEPGRPDDAERVYPGGNDDEREHQ